jgi:hypothetical protein
LDDGHQVQVVASDASGAGGASSSTKVTATATVAATMTTDVYTVGFCNMIRCPTPGEAQNFGYTMRTVHLGKPWCDRAWPGPLAPTPLQPSVVAGTTGAQTAVVLRPQAVTDDGITRPVVTGELEIVLKCDAAGQPGIAVPANASLILSGEPTAKYIPHRLELKSKCACPGGCGDGGDTPTVAAAAAAATVVGSPVAKKSTMPADGSFIVRLQHLYGAAEELGELSKPVTVDLQAVFCGRGQTVKAVQEMSLSANQKAEDVHHWKWQRRQPGPAQSQAASADSDQHLVHRVPQRQEMVVASKLLEHGTVVVMQPMATRTFVVTVQE